MNALVIALPKRGRRPSSGEVDLVGRLRVWERHLTLESLKTWILRGAVAALAVASMVMLVGWIVPQPESDLRPQALQLGLLPILAAAVAGLIPRRHGRTAAQLDQRLHLGDRLATAWAFRNSDEPIVKLQRANALERLEHHSATTVLRWRPARTDVIALGAVGFVTCLLLITPSPQQAVLDQQAAQQQSVDQAGQHLDLLREQAAASASLTPDQARQLDELLKQAQGELNQTHTQQEATAVLARLQDQMAQQLGDPNADLRDEALAAMSETLAAEPQTRALGDALQREDPQATRDAVQGLAAQADQLSDVERQALSRALQRAANVGRSDPRAASALRDAAQAIASGGSPATALSQADRALSDSIQASQSQAELNATVQRVRDLQAQLASGAPLPGDAASPSADQSAYTRNSPGLAGGTAVAIDSGSGRIASDSASGSSRGGAGVGPTGGDDQSQTAPAGQPAENVFVPGRPSDGPADQDLVNQPFTVRGAPRPYREVLSQYAQSSRDYVDRPDIAPNVRDLVKQYFQELEQGQ